MGVKVKKVIFVSLDDGKYFATVKGPFKTVQTKYGESLRWEFQTVNKDGSPGLVVSGLTGLIGSPKAKLTKWMAACGVELTDNEVDVDSCVGKEVVITTFTKQGSDFSNVVDCEPASMYRNVAPVQVQSPQLAPLPLNTAGPQQTPIKQ